MAVDRRARARVTMHAGRIERAVANAFQAGVVGVGGINVRNLADALASGGVEAVEPVIRAAVDKSISRLRQTLPPLVRDAMHQSAAMELGNLREQFRGAQDEEFPDLAEVDDSGEVPVVSDLDLRELGFDEFGVTITDELVEELATDLGESMTAGLLLLLGLGVVAGVSAHHLAQRIRLGLGLRPDQARAVANLARELATSNPGRLVTRFRPLPGVRSKPGFAVRIPAGGATPAWIQQQLLRYIPLQLKSRARLIGQTLSATAWERGKLLLWTLALRSGLLPPGTARRWVATLDQNTCPICRALHGQLAIIGEPFVSGDIGAIQSAPAHALCRCRTELTIGRALTAKQSIDRKDNTTMSERRTEYRTMTGYVGENPEPVALRACGKHHHGTCNAESTIVEPKKPKAAPKATKAPAKSPDKATTPMWIEALTAKLRAAWFPPDPYEAALEERRNQHTEVDR